MEWIDEVFAPTVSQYLTENKLPLRCLLIMDNAPAHPSYLADCSEHDFIQFKFLPPNTTSVLQPMDQQVISNFKKLYTKALFSRCFRVTEETKLTLKEFWKKHFNVFHCITLIDNAWTEVTYRTLNSAWRKLWPQCVTVRDFEGFDAEIVQEIVSMGNSMGLQVNDEDVEELVAEHSEDLTADELVQLHKEQQEQLARGNQLTKRRMGRKLQMSAVM
ncbi:tigger transposable element-derived protein 1-like [Macrobrachium rosenbergii]|uniref:tigger transposable element-derived protein 1-like n=1 Tax=Macrobrachium rosenbergii TaxID=79674 RepID=UPI0034D7AFD4